MTPRARDLLKLIQQASSVQTMQTNLRSSTTMSSPDALLPGHGGGGHGVSVPGVAKLISTTLDAHHPSVPSVREGKVEDL